MSRFEYRLASLDDDQALRSLLSSSAMDGGIAVAFQREPSYFGAAKIDGSSVQVIIVRDRETDRLIGMGSRAIQRRFVAGVPADVGYLSGLRLLPEYRGHAGILARGYRMFRALHEDGLAPFYLTTIAASNTRAIELLTSGRKPLPQYCDMGLYSTVAVPPAAKVQPNSPIRVRAAQSGDLDRLHAFLRDHGANRQFFPVYTREDLLSDRGCLRGLAIESILVATRGGTVVGALALWDQRAFKQSVVVGYPWWIGCLRPLYNAVSRACSKTTLPRVGEAINSRFAALFVVADEDPTVALALVGEGQAELHRQGADALLFGLHETDPLGKVVLPLAGHRFMTRLYAVHWEDQRLDIEALRRVPPYLEVARL